MKLVIDANIFFSALIKIGTTVEIILDNTIQYYIHPDLIDEVLKAVVEK